MSKPSSTTIAGCVVFGGVVGLAIYFAAPALLLHYGVTVSIEAVWTCAAIASFIAASVDIYLKNSEINKLTTNDVLDAAINKLTTNDVLDAAINHVTQLEEEAEKSDFKINQQCKLNETLQYNNHILIDTINKQKNELNNLSQEQKKKDSTIIDLKNQIKSLKDELTVDKKVEAVLAMRKEYKLHIAQNKAQYQQKLYRLNPTSINKTKHHKIIQKEKEGKKYHKQFNKQVKQTELLNNEKQELENQRKILHKMAKEKEEKELQLFESSDIELKKLGDLCDNGFNFSFGTKFK